MINQYMGVHRHLPFSLRYSLASLTASFPLKFVTETQKEAGSSSNYHFSGASCLTRWWFQILYVFFYFCLNVDPWEDSHFDEHITQMGWFITTDFSPKDNTLEVKWGPLFSGKSRLVKYYYYNLARCIYSSDGLVQPPTR